MAAVAMVTKVQKMLNSFQSSQSFSFHGNAILNFINTPKASTHYGEYFYDVS
jgi:hypothetical protein